MGRRGSAGRRNRELYSEFGGGGRECEWGEKRVRAGFGCFSKTVRLELSVHRSEEGEAEKGNWEKKKRRKMDGRWEKER